MSEPMNKPSQVPAVRKVSEIPLSEAEKKSLCAMNTPERIDLGVGLYAILRPAHDSELDGSPIPAKYIIHNRHGVQVDSMLVEEFAAMQPTDFTRIGMHGEDAQDFIAALPAPIGSQPVLSVGVRELAAALEDDCITVNSTTGVMSFDVKHAERLIQAALSSREAPASSDAVEIAERIIGEPTVKAVAALIQAYGDARVATKAVVTDYHSDHLTWTFDPAHGENEAALSFVSENEVELILNGIEAQIVHAALSHITAHNAAKDVETARLRGVMEKVDGLLAQIANGGIKGEPSNHEATVGIMRGIATEAHEVISALTASADPAQTVGEVGK